MQKNGLTDEWWGKIVDFLSQWIALRPRTKQFIYDRGHASLGNLTSGYSIISNKCVGHAPNNTLLEWKDVETLFEAARSIKDVASPVFASKLCHFIVPGVFPVIDQEVLGGSNNYKDYWWFCRNLWLATNDKTGLVKVLSDQIDGDIFPDYPWSTKIVELSLIGQRAS